MSLKLKDKKEQLYRATYHRTQVFNIRADKNKVGIFAGRHLTAMLQGVLDATFVHQSRGHNHRKSRHEQNVLMTIDQPAMI